MTLTPEEADNMLLAFVRAFNPDTERVSDHVLIGLGRRACEDLDSGATLDEIHAANMVQGFAQDYELAVFAMAPGAYCPEWSSTMEIWLSAF
ncbi:hypothetical protein GCM10027057_03700 [Marisediminicola antarctica]